MPFCHKCGAQNEPEAAYCEECGSRLVTAGQPTSPDTPAPVEPPAPAPSGDAGIPAPPGPAPAAGPPSPQRVPWRLLGALVLVAVLVAGGVGIYIALSGDDDGDKPLAVGEETATVVAKASPTVKATRKPRATPKATATPKSTPKPEPTATPEPPAVKREAQENAIAAIVEQSGEQYAGDCAITDIDTDVGKYCSSLWEDRGDSAVYALGLAFSEYGVWLLLEPVDGDWTVTDRADMVEEEIVPPW